MKLKIKVDQNTSEKGKPLSSIEKRKKRGKKRNVDRNLS